MKLGRNDSCSCGSGKKYKNCCMKKAESPTQYLSGPTPDELNLLGSLFNSGHNVELENRARSLLKQYPDSGIIWKLFGLSLQMQGKDALPAMQRAAALLPNDAEAHVNLAAVLRAAGQLDSALASSRRALEIRPDFAEAHNNLGVILKDLGQLEAASASYHKAVELKPDFAAAHNNLGIVLNELGQFDNAVASYRRALEIKPDFVDAHNNLGNALLAFRQLDDAIACYRRALEFKPDFALAQGNLLSTLNYTSHTPEYCLEEALKYGRMLTRKAASRFSAWQCAAQPERLRVGMVSGNLRDHPAGYFLEGMLAHIDPARVELIAYPSNDKQDELTARIRPYFSAWKPLSGKSDEAAARLIHADGVHVLLDLSGHSAHNRLPMFAWKPAPVQASWLDYFATTGVAEMDYLLADEVGVPEAQRGRFIETVWYLPDTRLCFTAPEADLPVAALPALKNGHITFGCFQRLTKVGDEVLKVWGKILSALPSAKLRWQCSQLGDPAVAAQFVEHLRRQGIDPARVTMHGAVSREAYLDAHAEVDVILDTFPFPGGTTTCEALWMGVPTLTLAGDTLLARQGASLLTAARLEDWVATSEEDYVARAVAVACNLPELAALRAVLREQVSTTPLFDAKRFARNFEAALWGMWQASAQSKRRANAPS